MKRYYITIALLLICIVSYGQSGPPATPIDGGLGILLAAGATYGLKKLRDSRK
ncbi:MAG: hypothetical protein NXI20_03150 [bacterium]|nr:hypothetical protein [bacterium]